MLGFLIFAVTSAAGGMLEHYNKLDDKGKEDFKQDLRDLKQEAAEKGKVFIDKIKGNKNV